MKSWAPLLLLVCTLGVSTSASAAKTAPPPNPGTALITGSDRGIGLALTREFISRGWQVIATCRDPSRATDLIALAKDHPGVSIETLDVTDHAAIEALVARLKGRTIDAPVNNAGVSCSFDGLSPAGLEPDEFARVLRVNSYAPQTIGISSGYGSIASVRSVIDSGYPTAYAYAMSKAALIMGQRMFALETANRQVTTVLLSPGAVDTDMQRNLRQQMTRIGKPIATPALTPEASAHAIVVTIEALPPEHKGKFLSREGNEIPW